MSDRAPRTPLRGVAANAPAVAFLAAFAGLFLQVLVHRMVSAKLINNFAFLVISLTMLGFAAPGVLLTTGAAAVACVYAPLRVLSSEGLRASGAGRYAVFFAGTGLGYMAIEIALVQKFGLVLGHPNLAVSVVIAGLLLWTGVGSMASQQQLLIPWLQRQVGRPFAGRVALVLAHLLPVGVLLGSFFPWALERLKAGSPSFAPWAWGINGIFSVVGPILSVAISTTWGMGALMLAAVPVYLLAAWSLPDAA